MPKFAICAEHFVKEGAMPRWLELARANSAASLLEAGVERFDILVDRERPNHAFLWEIYASYDAWVEHCKTDHFKAFIEGVPELLEKRVRNLLDLVT